MINTSVKFEWLNSIRRPFAWLASSDFGWFEWFGKEEWRKKAKRKIENFNFDIYIERERESVC